MDSRSQGHRIAIYGNGAVGRALRQEMGGVCPIINRGQEPPKGCQYALVCWPAHALVYFYEVHPSAVGLEVTTFCNGLWVPDNGWVRGCAYVRATSTGYTRGPKWRVGNASLAELMRGLGADVKASRNKHALHVWGKALYLLPLALACDDLKESARNVVKQRKVWQSYVDVVEPLAPVWATCKERTGQWMRACWLAERSPVGWAPSPSWHELRFFRDKLGLSVDKP